MPTSQPQPQPQPADAPPSYETATGSSSTPTNTTAARISTDGPAARITRNGIPPERRRSMEDENRPLPPGWIRQFDPIEQHQFFVDTKAKAPRSIWVHPYDDPEYLATLSPEEREKHGRIRRSMTLDDLAAEDTDDEGGRHHNSHPHRQTSRNNPELPPQNADTEPQSTGLHKFGRKMKDKLTATTHEQRQQQRLQREDQERRAYAAHIQARQAMARAVETGQPQFLCKDDQGRDVYIEPPNGAYAPQGAYGYNPYAHGPYTDPNARFVRPVGPYGRPYGRGYGGGYGVPVAAGFLGGALLGGLLF